MNSQPDRNNLEVGNSVQSIKGIRNAIITVLAIIGFLLVSYNFSHSNTVLSAQNLGRGTNVPQRSTAARTDLINTGTVPQANPPLSEHDKPNRKTD